MPTKELLGEEDYHFSVGGLQIEVTNLSKVYPDPNWFLLEHLHHDFEVHIIESGTGYITMDGHSFTVRENQFYITGPGVMHRQRSDRERPMTELCIEFGLSGEGAQELLEALSPVRYGPVAAGRDILRLFGELVQNLEDKPLGYHLCVQALIARLIVALARALAEGSPAGETPPRMGLEALRIQQVVRYVEVNLHHPITAADVCPLAGVGPRQLNRIFQRRFGMTFGEYLRAFRCDCAKRLLLSTRKSIADVAAETGFSGVQQLCRAIKRDTGQSPSALRREGMAQGGQKKSEFPEGQPE